MKKYLLPLVVNVALFSAAAANAGGLNVVDNKSMGCDFTDSMYIKGPSGSRVLELTGNGLLVQKVSATKFLIMGDCAGSSDGDVTVKIGTDNYHYATLTIVDGALMWNPEISHVEIVGGYFYAGMDHVTGTYTYTLKFSQ